MASQKVLFISATGIPIEIDKAADSIEALGYSVNDPSTGGIETTSNGTVALDDLMANDIQNTMTAAGGIAFPVVTDVAGAVDAFRLPSLAGAPSATPTVAGEGHLVWDSSNDKVYAWDGAAWKDLSISNEANAICNSYVADEALAANDTVYISAADNVSLGDVSGSGAASRIVGLAQAAAIDTAAVSVCSEGIMSGFTGLTIGARYYGDPATPGGIIPTVPTGSGNTLVQIGYAKSATQLHLHIAQVGRRT